MFCLYRVKKTHEEGTKTRHRWKRVGENCGIIGIRLGNIRIYCQGESIL